jgi:predicted RNA-binding Zn-ribbon protein involved in translation (DUF1610 family)
VTERADGIPGFVDADGQLLEGIHCTSCGAAVNQRMIATSYPCPGGQVRRRYCDCGTDVVTVERVIDRPKLKGVFLVHGFSGPVRGGPGGKSGVGQPASLIAQLVRALGGKVTRFK